MPAWTRAIVLGALALAACGGGDGEDEGRGTSRRGSTATAGGEPTTTAAGEPTTAAAGPTTPAPPSPQEAALLAEAAGQFADRPGRDQEVLEGSRAMCGSLDEGVSAGSSTLSTFVLGAMFRNMGEEAATILASLAARHLCPQHTATVEAFIASYDPSGPLPGALPGPGPVP
jgi:hypothetical protein